MSVAERNMRPAPPAPGWTSTGFRDSRGRRVTVFFPASHPAWESIGKAYWDERLEGLECIRRHAWGGQTRKGHVAGVGTCYFKRFSISNPRYAHKPYRARRTVRLQDRSRALGFHVPGTWCLLECRRFGLLVDSAVVMDELPGFVSTRQLLNTMPNAVIRSRADKRALLRAAGREVGRRHACGLFHGDLHPGNLFCRRDGNGFSFACIDNEEGEGYRRLPDRRRVHDLAHLNRMWGGLSPSDRMRFWTAYTESAGLSNAHARAVRRRVLQHSRRFWTKKGWLQ